MTIKKLLFLVFLIELVFFGVLIALVFRTSAVEKRLTLAEENRFHLTTIADRLRQSSDDLSRFARTYVVTNDTQYRDNYFTALAIRNGESGSPADYGAIYWDLVEPIRTERHPIGKKISLESIIDASAYSKVELAKLQLAKDNSNKLVNLEVEAFNAMAGQVQRCQRRVYGTC